MTGFRIDEFPFTRAGIEHQMRHDARYANWPAVYVLNSGREVYVGESLNVASRMRNHLANPERGPLKVARVVMDPTFNKSACLDLESTLIRLFAGDGRLLPQNGNSGITDAEYFDRVRYQAVFEEIFNELKERGLFTHSIPEIENSDLFKLSPFKALNPEQMVIVTAILEGLFTDLANGTASRLVIQGEPGTGKTVVAIYLMKLLSDIKANRSTEGEADTVLSDFFQGGYAELLRGFSMALVVPQQSLRKSVKAVFKSTPGLTPSQVLTPWELVSRGEQFDLVLVDEAHRLNQRAAQAAGPLNSRFMENNLSLFGEDDVRLTQIDWVNAVSRHQCFLVDEGQAVRPADVSGEVLGALVSTAQREQRHYRLRSQMRVSAGQDYVRYVRDVLDGTRLEAEQFDGYDLRFYEDLGAMREAVFERDAEVGLSRLLAGYAWDWNSKSGGVPHDFVLDGVALRWNSTPTDWVASPDSLHEVGSIHTIQGYDLNYAGVIIGPDLRLGADGRIAFDRTHYRDPRGTTNNRALGITYTDQDILGFVRNIYSVLLTRGMLGTFVYVCDPALREHLRRFFAGVG